MTMNLVWQLLRWCWWRKRLNADCVMAEQDNKGEMNARKKLHNVGMLLHCLMWLFPCIALLWLSPWIVLCGYPQSCRMSQILRIYPCKKVTKCGKTNFNGGKSPFKCFLIEPVSFGGANIWTIVALMLIAKTNHWLCHFHFPYLIFIALHCIVMHCCGHHPLAWHCCP